MDQAWFEMRDIRRRPVSEMVWIPVRSAWNISKQGRHGYPGFSKEFFGLGSVAVPLSQRDEAERLSWNDIGLIYEHRSHAYRNSYKPADVYQYDEEQDLGISLVIPQHFSDETPPEWHLHQDFIISLDLLREKDTWVSPNDGFLEVVKLKRDIDGHPIKIDVRAEFLQDYLAARQMALRITWYRQRIATVTDASFISWTNGRLNEDTAEERFEGQCWPAGEGGERLGSRVALFRIWRTDVDHEVDVPRFGPESENNTSHESHLFTRQSERTVFMVQGEVWRDEWIQPATHSVRIRGDDVPPTAYFFTDAGGAKESRATLRREDVGKYLWFRGSIITTLLRYRGYSLDWHTRDTGSIGLNGCYRVHFGVNGLGLINAYAYDVARLPDWQQQIWAGCNVTPEGGVSVELLAAQMGPGPADTLPPEKLFNIALDELNEAFSAHHGEPLLQTHNSTAEILRSLHRFRATDDAGLLALAKDVARVTADSMQKRALHAVVPPPKGEKWGSLKSLEKFLASRDKNADVHGLMSPLFGIYELRVGDAHLPSDKINEAFALAGINRTLPAPLQGAQLLEVAACTLHRAAEIVCGQRDPTG
ncbi:hypothetical protein [Afifella sp. YEN Y35]|uniref:hypothetical protein n=1 Tax=Afifella sp. YEN Y35 TaxID=3388337 RepID=UPI0039E01C72